jgi:LysR family transcriptional regulator, mexEF-oprN operon transcriptional activator
MPERYGRDLDLNLLRVFAAVADTGSVTEAAGRLYLTQPAVSAALRRLATAVGVPLFARQGRGLALTARGRQLHGQVRVHLGALVDAALAPADFDPRTSDRTLRLGLSDSIEVWLLPALLRVLEREAPALRLVSVPVQFRTVAAALTTGGLDAAVTVPAELPAGIRRQPLFWATFVCLFDPRHVRWRRRIGEAQYFAADHVIVSYNGDLRGLVEDLVRKSRRIRCSVSTFANLGAIVEGSALVATVPAVVARDICALRPDLRTVALPFALEGAPMELLWPSTLDDDAPGAFVRGHIAAIAAAHDR